MRPDPGVRCVAIGAAMCCLLAACSSATVPSGTASACCTPAPSHGLLPSGTVMAWGDNDLGSLGFGSATGPQRCGAESNPCATSPVAIAGLPGVSAVSAGAFYGLALDGDGTVWAWGDNRYGELGDGSTTERPAPVRVSLPSTVTAVVAGPAGELASEHSLALASDGSVWAWGANLFGQLGDGSTTDRSAPVHVRGLTGVIAIAAGGEFSLALTSDGSVWAWGDNRTGKLGVGTDNAPNQCTVDGGRAVYPCATQPVRVPRLSGIRGVAAGANHSVALASDGTVWSWGDNAQGEVGDGTTNDRDTPVRVAAPPRVVALAAGDTDSLALNASGAVWAWGDNSSGQLGDGTMTERDSPVEVHGLGGVVGIAAGSAHSVALTSMGSVWAWGDNAHGELGDGTTTGRSTPGRVPALSAATAVVAGLQYSVAVSTR